MLNMQQALYFILFVIFECLIEYAIYINTKNIIVVIGTIILFTLVPCIYAIYIKFIYKKQYNKLPEKNNEYGITYILPPKAKLNTDKDFSTIDNFVI